MNVQVPTGVATGGNANVVLITRGQTAPVATVAIRDLAPGLLAPASFKSGDKQYVAALRPNGTFVTNGTVPPETPPAPAVPGETLIFYGTGFGPVTPSAVSIAGQIVGAATELSATLEFKVGGTAARLAFAGLAPGLVGVYQFNVVLPADLPGGDQPLEVTVNGSPSARRCSCPCASVGRLNRR